MEKTNEKRNLMKRIMLMLCAAVVAISTILGSGVTEVQAASKAKKAMAAYAKYLAKGSDWCDDGKYTTFTLFDTNKDGIKELVVYDDGTYSFYVYGYCSGKVKCLGNTWKGGITFYPKKKIFACDSSVTAGFNSGEYYKYDGKKAKELAWYSVEYDGVGGKFISETYKVHGKKTSEKKYNKYIKSLRLGKGKSSWDFKMHKNTAANRNKYLSVSSKSTKVGKTSKITFPKYSTLDGAPYYKYNKADLSILGDVGSCEMKWKKVAGADGYKICVVWADETYKRTDTFYVVKKGKKYVIKDKNVIHVYCGIGKWKTLRDYESNPYKSRLYSKKMSKLQLVMLGGTSEEPIKVSVQAYKNVNGKKVYGKKVSKKVKYYM